MEFAFLPPYYIATVVAIFGLIIGSFLDVFASRFHTGTSINGRSHCTSCGHTLSWYELVPFFSYVFLRGRCSVCGGHIPIRLFIMEISCAVLFELAYLTTHTLTMFVLMLFVLSTFLVIAVYDIRHMVIPNEFVVVVFIGALVYLGYEAQHSASFALLLPHVLSGFAAAFFFAFLWFISKGRWIGLGDAKLAFPLGLMLTLTGTFSFIVLSFWIGALLSVLLLLLQHVLRSGQQHLPIFHTPLTMKSEVPFAPFMLLAFIAVFLGNVSVLSIMLHFV